jgi:hypothetical protein
MVVCEALNTCQGVTYFESSREKAMETLTNKRDGGGYVHA